MSDTTDQTPADDPLGEALHGVTFDVDEVGDCVTVEDARRIAEEAAQRAYMDIQANE